MPDTKTPLKNIEQKPGLWRRFRAAMPVTSELIKWGAIGMLSIGVAATVISGPAAGLAALRIGVMIGLRLALPAVILTGVVEKAYQAIAGKKTPGALARKENKNEAEHNKSKGPFSSLKQSLSSRQHFKKSSEQNKVDAQQTMNVAASPKNQKAKAPSSFK